MRRISYRWLHALTLVATACTPSPSPTTGDAAKPGAPGQAPAPEAPSILPARSLAVDELRTDLAPPMSLTATDGTGLRLVSLKARAVIEGPLAFTELELEFENPQPRRIEGRFEIELPSRAAISRFAMKIGANWQEGEVVERQAARRAYEDFLHRRQDPALLEHDAGNSFGARVFPIEANARKQIILSYSQELVHDGEAYRLPLRGLPEIDALDVSATIAGSDKPAQTWVESDIVPPGDFEVELAAKGTAVALRHQEQALARVTVGGEAEPVAIADLVVLFDTSASQAIGFDRRIRRTAGVLRALERDTGAPIPLTIVAFDQTTATMFEGTTATLDDAALARLATRRALGASDLAGALRSLGGTPGGDRRLLLVTDGVSTTGSKELVGIERAASELAAKGFARIDAIADGSRADEMLQAVTTAPSMAPGIVMDADLDDAAMVRKLRTMAFEALDVVVPDSKWVWPERVEGVQPGDELLVYAELPPGAAMRVGLGDDAPMTTVATDVTGPLLRRAWMRAFVQRMTDRRARLLEIDTHGREAMRKLIVDLSVRERVLSEFTGLLVLETEADYRRFGIDRKALADILAIGPGGVELVRREGNVSIATAPVRLPEAPEWLVTAAHLHVKDTDGKWDKAPRVPGGMPSSLGKAGGGGIDTSTGTGGGALDEQRNRGGLAAPADEGGMGRTADGLDDPGSADGDAAPEEEAAEKAVATARDLPADRLKAEPAIEPEPQAAPPPPPSAKPIESEIDALMPDEAPAKKRKAPTRGELGRVARPWSPPPVPPLGKVTIGKPAIDGVLAAAHVEATLATRQVLLAWCGTHAMPGAPLEHGTLDLHMVVGEAGDVALARVKQRDVLDIRLVHCLENAATRWSFTPDKPGTTTFVSVQLGFGASKPGEASLDDAAAMRKLVVDLETERKRQAEEARKQQEIRDAAAREEQKEIERTVGSPYTGKMFDVMGHLAAGRTQDAITLAAAWQLDQPGDVVALIALGEAAEKAGDGVTAARAYGSIIDLFPSRADLRRYASYRLSRVGGDALAVAIDSASEAVASRPDHPSSHRALAFALVAAGQHRRAAAALVAGIHAENVAWGRFHEVQRILREDLALVAAAWAASESAARPEIEAMLRTENVTMASSPSLRFVLTWETDANDVDFHIHDGKAGHAYFSDKVLPSGGSLYADITTGYGPECFAIEGEATAYPYNLRAHYYSRGPMGYGTGRVQAVQHDGKGGLVLREYPFVVMKDQEWIDLGTIKGKF